MKLNTEVDLNTVTVTRLIRASQEKVYEAWTDVNLYRQWFGPEDCNAREVEMDVRLGGKFRVAVGSKMGELEAHGEFTEVTPYSRLAYTWDWRGNPELEVGETHVVVDLKSQAEGTLVTITHSGFRDAEMAGEHEVGWSGSLDKLENLIGTVD